MSQPSPDPTGEVDFQDTIESEDDENALVLDPNNSERQYWRDPLSGVMREIWRPGDGDGRLGGEFWEQRKPPAALKDRWRFYQLSDGPVRRYTNEPPRHVVLDDRAAYEVLQSNIPRTHLVQSWHLDFGGPGTVRQRREHRGRGAVGDPHAHGNDRFHFGYHQNKTDRYHFSGERADKTGYRPVVYYCAAAAERKRERELEAAAAQERAAEEESSARRKRAHNQYTPREQLVKHGAQGEAKKKRRGNRVLSSRGGEGGRVGGLEADYMPTAVRATQADASDLWVPQDEADDERGRGDLASVQLQRVRADHAAELAEKDRQLGAAMARIEALEEQLAAALQGRDAQESVEQAEMVIKDEEVEDD